MSWKKTMAACLMALMASLTAASEPSRMLKIAPVQADPEWSWLAVAEMIFEYYGVPNAIPSVPYECAIGSLFQKLCAEDCRLCLDLPQATPRHISVLIDVLQHYPKYAKGLGRGEDTAIFSTPKDFSAKEVTDEVDAGRPLVLGVSFGPKCGPGSDHFALIVGYSVVGGSLRVFVNDPFPVAICPENSYAGRGGRTEDERGTYSIEYGKLVELARGPALIGIAPPSRPSRAARDAAVINGGNERKIETRTPDLEERFRSKVIEAEHEFDSMRGQLKRVSDDPLSDDQPNVASFLETPKIVGYRLDDVALVWSSAQDGLTRAAKSLGLRPMEEYIALFYPQAPKKTFTGRKTGALVSVDEVNSLFERIETVFSKIESAASDLQITIYTSTDPPTTECFLYYFYSDWDHPMSETAGEGGSFSNIYRGIYRYKVQAQGFKPIRSKAPLNLVDQEGNVLACKLFRTDDSRYEPCVLTFKH